MQGIDSLRHVHVHEPKIEYTVHYLGLYVFLYTFV